ncbi:cell envelope integrity protein CreD [Sungkyunkwania multivorans]|uniref:Cell envelope integrity protein CreD n=1 Tax=Sungkyunkwania multivorans TaxID=1173618 RepID=A0ABW3CSE6_9FLAO
MENTTQNNRFGNWLRTSITARMLMVGFLILILLIPLIFIKELIRERAQRQNEVISEINEKWGNELLFSGPILRIPYRTYRETVKLDQKTGRSIKERQVEIKAAYFFPDELNIDGSIDAQPKNRSIYETIVYTAKLKCKGSFTTPNFQELDIDPEDIIWSKATVLIKTSNLKGIRDEVRIQLNEAQFPLIPKYQNTDNYNFSRIVQHNLTSRSIAWDKTNGESVSFAFDFNVNGSERIRFVPLGKETKVHMVSNWPSPSFMGNFLPNDNADDRVDQDGFKASWTVLQTNRQFEQQFFGSLPDLSEFAFGADLIVPVDQYQKSERTAKYGFLVIALTFLVFFLIQTLSKINIHPFQYLMIGIALVMFYTLLISISEHSSYLKAYLVAGGAVVLLITLYSRSILKNFKFPLFIALSLIALYSFIFVIIQLENYALLVGSLGLFFILAMVMFVSRKIDWQQ